MNTTSQEYVLELLLGIFFYKAPTFSDILIHWDNVIDRQQTRQSFYLHCLTHNETFSLTMRHSHTQWDMLTHNGTCSLTMRHAHSQWDVLTHNGTCSLTMERAHSQWDMLTHNETCSLTMRRAHSQWDMLTHNETCSLTMRRADSHMQSRSSYSYVSVLWTHSKLVKQSTGRQTFQSVVQIKAFQGRQQAIALIAISMK